MISTHEEQAGNRGVKRSGGDTIVDRSIRGQSLSDHSARAEWQFSMTQGRYTMRKLTLSLFALALALGFAGSIHSVIAAPSFATMELSAQLMGGAEEVPNPGDPDGTGTSTVTLDSDSGQASFTINVSNITLPAAAAHIHEGARGVAGDVVVPLTAPDANGTATGSAAVDAALMQRMMDNPAGFYVNVHTTDFPGGAVRGQLAAAGGAGAPTTMPAAGASDSATTFMFGLALLALVAGLGLNWNSRRRTNAR